MVRYAKMRCDVANAENSTGDRSAAANTGDQSAAEVYGKQSVAIATGVKGKAKGAKGCWLVLAEYANLSDGWNLKWVKTAYVDGKKIKADTFYALKNGRFVEVTS